MSSIPLPALHVAPSEAPDPLAQVGKLLSVRSLLNQQQGQQIQLQQQQQALKDQQASTAALMELDPSKPDDLPNLILKHGGSSNAAIAAQQHLLSTKETAAKIAKDTSEAGATDLTTKLKKADFFNGALESLKQVPDDQLPQAIQQTAAEMVKQGVIDPQHAESAAKLAQLPPEQARQQIALLQKGSQLQTVQFQQAQEQQKTAAQVAKDQAQTANAQIEGQQKQRVLAGTSPTGITAEQQAQLGQSKQRLGLESGRLAEEQRHNRATEGQLTPEALDMAADSFAKTGQLPQVGRSGAVRAQIINAAAAKNPTLDPVKNAAEYKANEGSLKKLQSQFDATTAFEETAGKNLDQFLGAAKNIVDTGSPALNAPLRMISNNVFGSKAQAVADAARQVAVNEVAKVTGSPGMTGQLSDSARHEVEAFNPRSATLGQTIEVAKILRQDMSNRRQSYGDQIEAIKGRLGSRGNATAAPESPAAGGFNWNQFPEHK